MSTGLIFITARDVDVKLVNRFLLHLRCWQGPKQRYEDFDMYHIVRTFSELVDTNFSNDPPPLQDFVANAYKGMTLQSLESIMAPYRSKPLFLILDDEGVQNKTVILLDYEPDHDAYNKMRIPWQEVDSVYNNLDIGNMDFVEFTEEANWGPEKPYVENYRALDDWWTYKQRGPICSHEAALRRDTAIKELGKLDLA